MGTSTQKRRGLPLTAQLVASLVVGALLLSFVVGYVGASASVGREQAMHSDRMDLCVSLAARAGNLIERDDKLRLSVLATSAADLAACRVIILGQTGKVRLDTGIALSEKQLKIESQDGPLQRSGDEGGFEVLAPALGNEGFAGEVRLRYRMPELVAAAGLSWSLFGITFLASLSLVGMAWWVCHTWVAHAQHIVRRVDGIARGERVPPPSTLHHGVLGDLEDAITRVGAQTDRRLREVEEGVIEMAKHVVHTLEQRGLTSPGHGERTKRYSLILADAVELDASQRRAIEISAQLIDLGKSWVRPTALQKLEGLDTLERESLRRYPQRGAAELARIPSLHGVAEAMRHHREKYNGEGYPDGLRGVCIPLSSRILAIAEAYDLLTCRVDGAGMTWPEALDRLHEDRGEHFDPDLLDLFEDEMRKSPVPATKKTAVVISQDGVAPYKLAEEPAIIDEDDVDRLLGDDDTAALFAAAESELEVLGDEGFEGGRL